MKIVNKNKFIKMVTLTLGIIIGLSFYFSNISFSKGDVKKKTIYVSSGDTLWTIASQEQENNIYYNNKDIRDIVFEIKKINNLDNNSNLQVGQKLIVNNL